MIENLKNLSKDELNDLYINQGKSLNDIAVLFKCNIATVWRFLKKNEIQIRNVKEATIKATVNNCFISRYIKDLIEGELLGDGNLRVGRASAQFCYTSKHYDYIEWLKNIFQKNGIICGKTYKKQHKEGNITY